MASQVQVTIVTILRAANVNLAVDTAQEEYLRMGLPELVADTLSKPRAPRSALARDFALAFLRQEKELLLRTAELSAISAEMRSLTMRYLSTRKELCIRGVIGAPCIRRHPVHHKNITMIYPRSSSTPVNTCYIARTCRAKECSCM